MFTINLNLRFALIAAGLVLTIALWWMYGFWWSFPFLLATIVLVVGYLLLGTVQSSAMLIQAQKFDEAEQQLNKTYFPNLLFSMNRAYYYMLHATINMQRKDYATTEKHLNTALSLGLPTDNEKAAAYFQLANIAAVRNNWAQAEKHLAETKKLNVTEPMIKDQLKEFDKAMKNRGNAANPSNIFMANRGGGGVMGGGKRRQPRMR